MVARSAPMCLLALIVIGAAGYGLSRVPTGFLPIEDQGYVLAIAQLPDGASLERTKRVMDQVSAIAGKVPGVDNVVGISGVSALDNMAILANGAVAYIVLKDWSVRGPGEDLRSLIMAFNKGFSAIEEARIVVYPPPPIQGIGNAAGFTMQVQLRDGSFDLSKLQTITNTIVKDAESQSGLQRVTTTYRATVPQLKVAVDRIKADTLQVTIDDVFSTLSAYLGSSYVGQFNKFGHVFQVYVQADSQYRLRAQDIELLPVRNKQGEMIPLGTLVQITPIVGPSLLSLYNLYPSSLVQGLPATGFSSGEAMSLMEQIADKVLPRGAGYDWTAMSYQEKLLGNQIYYIFALAMLLVYLVLGGQYESWVLADRGAARGAVIPGRAGHGAHGAGYGQQSLYPDRLGTSDRALGEECDPDRRSGTRAADIRRQADRRGGGGSGARAVPAHSDDFVRVHSRGGATGAGNRRRRQRAQVDRHCGVQWDAHLDLPCRAVRAVVLCRDPPVRGMARRAQGKSRGEARPRRVKDRARSRRLFQ